MNIRTRGGRHESERLLKINSAVTYDEWIHDRFSIRKLSVQRITYSMPPSGS